MNVSVALCTYQGERFLPDQLRSYAAQTVVPAELVVCDDGSTDGTHRIVDAFAATAPFPVRLHVNTERLGVTANFSKAVSLCSGSVIALSDQDDVWMPGKLQRQLAILEDQPSIGAVFTDAELVDGSLLPLGRSMFGVTHLTERRRQRMHAGGALEVLMARSVVCGATLAFRSSFRDLVLPIPTSGLHDVWLSVLLAAVTRVSALSEPLVLYRQHGANQVGAPATGPLSKLRRRRRQGVYGDEVAHYRALAARLVERAPADSIHPEAIELIERKVEHLLFRNQMPRHRAVPVLTELARGRYHRYSRGLESAIYDLLFRHPAAA